jgi:hypothetical protein
MAGVHLFKGAICGFNAHALVNAHALAVAVADDARHLTLATDRLGTTATQGASIATHHVRRIRRSI